MPKTKTITKTKKDVIEIAKSVLDEIIEETESEDWDKPVNKVAQSGGKARAARLTLAERAMYLDLYITKMKTGYAAKRIRSKI